MTDYRDERARDLIRQSAEIRDGEPRELAVFWLCLLGAVLLVALFMLWVGTSAAHAQGVAGGSYFQDADCHAKLIFDDDYSYFPTDTVDGFCDDTVAKFDVILDAACYIEGCNGELDIALASDICNAAWDYEVPVALLLCIIKRESSFNPTARNRSSGCYGLMQLHPHWHKARLRSMGWDWHARADNVAYGAWLIRRELDEGKGLYAAISPWTVRPRAWAEYQQIKTKFEVSK